MSHFSSLRRLAAIATGIRRRFRFLLLCVRWYLVTKLSIFVPDGYLTNTKEKHVSKLVSIATQLLQEELKAGAVGKLGSVLKNDEGKRFISSAARFVHENAAEFAKDPSFVRKIATLADAHFGINERAAMARRLEDQDSEQLTNDSGVASSDNDASPEPYVDNVIV